jgi:hypothetical protein
MRRSDASLMTARLNSSEAIAIWHRFEQSRPPFEYQAHRHLCELYLRAKDKAAAEHHRQLADKLWVSEDVEPPLFNGLLPHAMDADELALLQSKLQPLFQHTRAIWLCRDTPPSTANPPRWFLYVQAYDSWFMRLVGKLTVRRISMRPPAGGCWSGCRRGCMSIWRSASSDRTIAFRLIARAAA